MTTEQVLHKIHREEGGKIISVLTKIFGTSNLQLGEDMMQDAFIEAIEKWGNKIPKNPKGWIYTVTKNKVINTLNRKKDKQGYQSEIAHLLSSDWTRDASAIDQLFSEEEIQDDQLKMMFTCCNPEIDVDSQTALILKTLCGFGIPEIAKAYLVSDDTINKRLSSARKKIKETRPEFKIPETKDINQRLSVVLNTIYLLFNEGYSASSGDKIILFELCLESIRLTELIIESDLIKNKGEAHGLLSLMNFNASRFIARISEDGQITTMEHQDRSKWDRKLISKGVLHLNKAIVCDQVSKFLILAAISANHCSATTFESTNWKQILSLYDQMLLIDNSPIVHLNRVIAVSMVNGKQKGIELLMFLKGEKSLANYHRLFSVLGDLYEQTNQNKLAIAEYQTALSLTKLVSEKKWIEAKIEKCR